MLRRIQGAREPALASVVVAVGAWLTTAGAFGAMQDGNDQVSAPTSLSGGIGTLVFDTPSPPARRSVSSYLISGGDTVLGDMSVPNLTATNGARVTTTRTGNITGFATVDDATLNLGADLSLTGRLDVRSGVVNANGHAIGATDIDLGKYGGTGTIAGDGAITATNLSLGANLFQTLHGGDDSVASSLSIGDGATLSVVQAAGELTGLTFHGNTASDLAIAPTGVLNLRFASQPQSGDAWIFRWQDPSGGGDWIGTLQGLIDAGRITFSAPGGAGLAIQGGSSYSLVSQGGYTYIGLPLHAVPEPSSMVLLGLGLAGAVALRARRRRA